jgi:threonine aldolase
VAAGFDQTSLARSDIDILVVGGTKAGMPPTEAMVIFDRTLARRLDARLKQVGQLPSKGRYYAAPFIGMLESGAFVQRAAHANAMAQRLAAQMPFPLRHKVEANAVFIELDEARTRALAAAGWFVYRFLDGSVRFLCSWATTPDSVDAVGEALRDLR